MAHVRPRECGKKHTARVNLTKNMQITYRSRVKLSGRLTRSTSFAGDFAHLFFTVLPRLLDSSRVFGLEHQFQILILCVGGLTLE